MIPLPRHRTGCPITIRTFHYSAESPVSSGSILRKPSIDDGGDVDIPRAINLRNRVVTGYAGLSVIGGCPPIDGWPVVGGAIERFWGGRFGVRWDEMPEIPGID